MEQKCPNCGKNVEGVSSPTVTELIVTEYVNSSILIDPAPTTRTVITMKDLARAGKNAIMKQKQIDFVCPDCGTKWQVIVKL